MLTLKITFRYCLALYCITMLYSSLHELIHHFSGYLICGKWGYKSFNYFSTACEGAQKSWYATYTGPIFNYIMMYIGAAMLKGDSNYKKHLGFALIFAQLPLQRMVTPFFRKNDEFIATISLYGDTQLNYWLVIIVIWAICIPPLIKAFLAIQNRRRWLWFLFYLTLLPYLLWGPVFGILEYLMVSKHVLDQQIIGIGLLFIINEIVTIIAYLLTKKYIDPDYKRFGGLQT